MRPANERYEHAVDYHIYHFVRKYSEFEGNVSKNTSKWALRLQTQMQSNMFDAIDPRSVIRFQSASQLTCDILRIYEGVEM